MGLLIYSTLARRKEPFAPVDPTGREVTLYNCGPTVYDRFHIGNARNFIFMDLVRRYLRRLGYQVRFAQNLTDIDDKIIARAREAGLPAEEIAERYARAYFEDAQRLGIERADLHPRATDYVGPMIDFMKELEARRLAYPAAGSLYFRVRAFDGYGKLSGRRLEELRQGARVEIDPAKEDPLDFVLWKAAKPGEPKWPSPWGEGRPGWHTECAVMVRAIFGDRTIDIHAGGSDLMFPHHENEIAQVEALCGRPLARFWMHNGFLNIESEKMSKSLGNIRRVDQVLAEGFSPPTVRYFFFTAHYRHPMDYNRRALEEAAAAVHRLQDALQTGERLLSRAGQATPSGEPGRSTAAAGELLARFEAAMNDDFNTPQALAVLHDLVTEIHEARSRSALDRLAALVAVGRDLAHFFGIEAEPAAHFSAKLTVSASATLDQSLPPGQREHALLQLARSIRREAEEADLEEAARAIAETLRAHGLSPQADDAKPAFWRVGRDGARAREGLIELLIQVRNEARRRRAFPLADLIRARLAELDILLEDHPQGTIWKESAAAPSGPPRPAPADSPEARP